VYRVSQENFHYIAHLIRPLVQPDIGMSLLSNGVNDISAELCLHCTLRWHGGGCPHDISMHARISLPSFYRVLGKTLEAINSVPELAFALPRPPSGHPDEVQSLADSFSCKASKPVFQGCVGAIDGWLVNIRCPARKSEQNIRSFFSGQYKCFGLNVQAMCDGNSKFTFFANNSPGSTNDIVAYRKLSVFRLFC
jgi:hypothetical protein